MCSSPLLEFSSQLSSFLLGKKSEAHAPGGGLPRLCGGHPLLLAAAASVLADEEPTPAWGALDPAAAPEPVQPLQPPHCGHDCPPPLATALRLCRLRVGLSHAALHTLRPLCCGLLRPGWLHFVPAATAGPPATTCLPHTPAGPAVSGTPTPPPSHLWRRRTGATRGTPKMNHQGPLQPGGIGAADHSRPVVGRTHRTTVEPAPRSPPVPASVVRGTQEARGRGQLLSLIKAIYYYFLLLPPAESETRTQAGSRETRIPSGRANPYRRLWGTGEDREEGPRKGSWGLHRDRGPCSDLLSHPNQLPSLPHPTRREIDQ